MINIDKVQARPGLMICLILSDRGETTEGGIIIGKVGHKKEVPVMARVLKVGKPGIVKNVAPITKKVTHDFETPEAEVGETVYFKRYRGKPLWDTHIVLQNADLLTRDDGRVI